MKNITALICAFVKFYHTNDNNYQVINDKVISKIIKKEEYKMISESLNEGISFFNKEIVSKKKENIGYIVNNNIGPTIIGRTAFNDKSLLLAKRLGIKQQIIFGSGYDTTAYRFKNIITYELDREEIINDKIKRIKENNIDCSNVKYIKTNIEDFDWIDKLIDCGFIKNKKTYCSLLGLTYYLSEKVFDKLLNSISNIVAEGSTIVFDYPLNIDNKIGLLASGANEKMQAEYSYEKIEKILEKNDMLVYEHLTCNEINKEFFNNYNILNPNNKLIAPCDVNYCLAVKKH